MRTWKRKWTPLTALNGNSQASKLGFFFWPNCFVLSIFGLMVSTDSHALFCLFVYWFNGCTALLVCWRACLFRRRHRLRNNQQLRWYADRLSAASCGSIGGDVLLLHSMRLLLQELHTELILCSWAPWTRMAACWTSFLPFCDEQWGIRTQICPD